MAVFKAFVSTAQREFVAQERAKNPAATQFRVRCWLGRAVWCLVGMAAASQSSGGLCGWRLVWAHSCGTVRLALGMGPQLCGWRLIWAHSCGAGCPAAAISRWCSLWLCTLPTCPLSHLPTCPPAPCSPEPTLPTCTLLTCTHPAHLPAAPTRRVMPTRRWSGCARASAPRTSTW